MGHNRFNEVWATHHLSVGPPNVLIVKLYCTMTYGMLKGRQARPGACSPEPKGQIVPPTLTLGPGRLLVNQTNTRKPFVAPRLKEEASLTDVTLITGGGQPTFRRTGRLYQQFKKHGGHQHGGGYNS